MRSQNKFVVWLFTKIWSHRLIQEDKEEVVAVKGWRTCVIDNKWGSRKMSTFLFGKP